MIQEEIDYFHPPKVSLKVVFAVWREKVPQGRRSGSSLGNGPQKLRRRLRDAVIAQQRFAQRGWFPPGPRDLFIAGRAERMDDFIDQLWVVGWINGQGIANFEAQPPFRQIELE